MKNEAKRVILTDSSLNRHGFRVLTSGINLDGFLKNPIMLWNHFRDEGSAIWGNYLPIGHWEDIKVEGDVITAIPVFDEADELSRVIKQKYEAGTISTASIGANIEEATTDPSMMIPGQTKPTISKCDLLEVSMVDIPANSNAVKLYYKDSDNSYKTLAVSDIDKFLPGTKFKKNMKLKATWIALLSFLGIENLTAENEELSAEKMESINGEMTRLKAENTTLTAERDQLKISSEGAITAKTTLETEKTNLTTENIALKAQVEALKKAPAGEESKPPAPEGEPAA